VSDLPNQSGDASPRPAPERRRWPVVAGTVALALVAIVVTAMAFIKVPYVIISPGDATPLDDDVVSISGAETFEHDGSLLFLTVRVSSNDPNVWRWLFAQLDDDVSIEEREDVLGCASYDDNANLQDQLMRQSQDIAKEVALRRLGYEVPEVAQRAMIIDVQCDGPSEGELHSGDRITAVDGTPVQSADEVGPLVQAKAPGDRVVVSVEREGEPQDVTVKLGQRDGVAFLGIVSQTLYDWTFPFDIEIDTQRVSGPSAGLAFALAIVDDLTPGDLTGGREVAVTGSIGADGSVGPVGGIAQKAVTARDDGATLMLVPRGEAAEAREHAGSMTVVAVRTLDDALGALERAGGEGVETPAPTAPATGATGQ
jgi:PDZ domain-containing protein